MCRVESTECEDVTWIGDAYCDPGEYRIHCLLSGYGSVGARAGNPDNGVARNMRVTPKNIRHDENGVPMLSRHMVSGPHTSHASFLSLPPFGLFINAELLLEHTYSSDSFLARVLGLLLLPLGQNGISLMLFLPSSTRAANFAASSGCGVCETKLRIAKLDLHQTEPLVRACTDPIRGNWQSRLNLSTRNRL